MSVVTSPWVVTLERAPLRAPEWPVGYFPRRCANVIESVDLRMKVEDRGGSARIARLGRDGLTEPVDTAALDEIELWLREHPERPWRSSWPGVSRSST